MATLTKIEVVDLVGLYVGSTNLVAVATRYGLTAGESAQLGKWMAEKASVARLKAMAELGASLALSPERKS